MPGRRFTIVAGGIYLAVGLGFAILSFFPDALHLADRILITAPRYPEVTLALYAGVVGGLTAGLGAMVAGVAQAAASTLQAAEPGR